LFTTLGERLKFRLQARRVSLWG